MVVKSAPNENTQKAIFRFIYIIKELAPQKLIANYINFTIRILNYSCAAKFMSGDKKRDTNVRGYFHG